MNTEWLSPDSAPRDGTPIIGDFGYPWPLVALWDEYDEHWNYCTVQASPMVDGPVNTWFETEYEGIQALKRWMPMPSLT